MPEGADSLGYFYMNARLGRLSGNCRRFHGFDGVANLLTVSRFIPTGFFRRIIHK